MTNSARKVQALLKHKYTLKRKVPANSKSCLKLSGLQALFSWVGVGEVSGWRRYLQYRWYYNDIRLAKTEQRTRTWERLQSLILDGRGMSQGYSSASGSCFVSHNMEGRGAAQGYLACLLTLAFFSLLESQVRSQNRERAEEGFKEKFQRSILKGRGECP